MLTVVRQKNTPFGGAENYLSRLTEQLTKQNVPFEVIYCSAPKWLPSWLKALWFNYQVCYYKGNKFYFSLDRIKCADVYRAGDGVHKAFLQTKRISLNPLNIVYIYLEINCFRHADLIIANSLMVKQQIIKYYGIPDTKIQVIYNGVNIKPINYILSKNKIYQEFGLTHDPKIILFVGNGFERKGVAMFIEIIAQIKSNIVAFIVGKDKNLKYYRRLARSTGKTIIFTGERIDVADFYSVSDIFLLPTQYEPFSNTVLEAMSFKTVVFTTSQNGACEILPPEFLIKENISSEIDNVLNNSDLLNRIKEQNYQLVKDFSMAKNTQETLQAIYTVRSQAD